MYYRFYRRRTQLYILAGVVLLVFLYFQQNGKSIENGSDNMLVERKHNGKARINIDNYVQPPACGDCPGENGKPVYLTVRIDFIFCINYLYYVRFIERLKSLLVLMRFIKKNF